MQSEQIADRVTALGDRLHRSTDAPGRKLMVPVVLVLLLETDQFALQPPWSRLIRG